MAGFQKVYRDIQKHWLWEDKPFSRGQAFIDLILSANHQNRKILIDSKLIEVERGSQITSLRKLGEAWGWSSKKVKKFLEQLQKDEMITYKSDSKKTVVTIENYSHYQDVGNSKETALSPKNNKNEKVGDSDELRKDTKVDKVGSKKETTETIEITNLEDDNGNREETEKKQQGNSEETQKKHRGNAEEIQRKTNKKDKEYIKNEEEGKEGEENTPSLPPLSFPTPYHEAIFNQWQENTYRTWFMNTEIEDKENEIVMLVQTEFVKNIINEKFKKYLDILLGKKVVVRLKE